MLLGKHILNCKNSGPSIPIGSKWEFTENSTFEIPSNGNYKIILVGAGGKGGDGGKAYVYTCSSLESRAGGGGGGGGGAGQTVEVNKKMRFGDIIDIVIGKTNSAASKITGATTITANGGNAGGNGQTVDIGWGGSCGSVWGGAVGANYGTGGSNGSNANFYNVCNGGAGGRGKVSTYGNGYGSGGAGGKGATQTENIPSNCSGQGFTWYPSGDGSGPGKSGTQGICVIEYLGK